MSSRLFCWETSIILAPFILGPFSEKSHSSKLFTVSLIFFLIFGVLPALCLPREVDLLPPELVAADDARCRVLLLFLVFSLDSLFSFFFFFFFFLFSSDDDDDSLEEDVDLPLQADDLDGVLACLLPPRQASVT